MRLKISLILLIISLVPASSPADDGYRWPLSAPPALTSTFAEHRSGHFHAGLDLKTWGKQGYAVHAVADGYVWRVRTSPWGYGRAVYLRLEDGRTAVYAHLSGFNKAIESAVRAEQVRQGRYSVDLYPPPGSIPVQAGQEIARSGRSGCAHPHLHFELRDENNRPLNPLCHGFDVSDVRSPRMVSVAVRPLGRNSSVDGHHRTAVIPLRWDAGRGCYTISSIPHIEGRAGLSLSVYDLADAAQNRLHVYGLKLTVDGREVFASEYRRFEFETSDQVDLDIDFGLYRRGRGLFRNLYLAPGNRLSFYRTNGPADGVLDTAVLGPGLHRVILTARDRAGNRSQARFQLLLDERPRVEHVQLAEDSSGILVTFDAVDPDGAAARGGIETSRDLGRHWIGQPAVPAGKGGNSYRARFDRGTGDVLLVRAWAEDEFGIRSWPVLETFGALPDRGGEPGFEWELSYHGDFIEITLRADRPLRRSPRVLFNRPGREPQAVIMSPRGTDRWQGRCSLVGGADGEAVLTAAGRDLSGGLGVDALTLRIDTVTPGEGGEVRDPVTGAEVVFPPGAVYQAFAVRIEESQAGDPPGCAAVGPACAVHPRDRSFNEPATLWLPVTPEQEANPRIGVYRRRGSDTWSYAGRLVREGGGALGARVKRFSTFALLEDLTDPIIWRLRPANGARISQRRPALSAGVRDRGSGIGREEDIVLTVDGFAVIAEWDPPVETVRYRPPEPLSPGEHRLEVTVTDRAGNRTTRGSRFTIMP
jgi:hypothetical protein